MAPGNSFRWTGNNTTKALLIGEAGVRHSELRLEIRIENANWETGTDDFNGVGISLMNLTTSRGELRSQLFSTGVELFADQGSGGCAWNQFYVDSFGPGKANTDGAGLRFSATGGGWVNENWIYGGRIGRHRHGILITHETPWDPPDTPSGYYRHNGNSIVDIDIEGAVYGFTCTHDTNMNFVTRARTEGVDWHTNMLDGAHGNHFTGKLGPGNFEGFSKQLSPESNRFPNTSRIAGHYNTYTDVRDGNLIYKSPRLGDVAWLTREARAIVPGFAFVWIMGFRPANLLPYCDIAGSGRTILLDRTNGTLSYSVFHNTLMVRRIDTRCCKTFAVGAIRLGGNQTFRMHYCPLKEDFSPLYEDSDEWGVKHLWGGKITPNGNWGTADMHISNAPTDASVVHLGTQDGSNIAGGRGARVSVSDKVKFLDIGMPLGPDQGLFQHLLVWALDPAPATTMAPLMASAEQPQIEVTWSPGSVGSSSTATNNVDWAILTPGMRLAVFQENPGSSGPIITDGNWTLAATCVETGKVRIELTNNTGGSLDPGELKLAVRLLL
jgi:hypothetical protein